MYVLKLIKRSWFLFILSSNVFLLDCLVWGVADLPLTFSLISVDGKQVPLQNGIPYPTFEVQNSRTIFSLAGDWKKLRMAFDHDISLRNRAATLSLIENEGGNCQKPGYDDASWTPTTLPAVENTMCVYEAKTGPEKYEDGVWYRRHFTADNLWSGKYVKLILPSANYVADVWINGAYLGYHEGGYTPVVFDVSDKLSYGADNVIAVRVDNIPWGRKTGNDDIRDILPYKISDWFNYTGIIGKPYLEICNPVTVVRADVKTMDINGTVNIAAVVLNHGTTSVDLELQADIYDTKVNDVNLMDMAAESLINAPVGGPLTAAVSLAPGQTRVIVWQTRISNPQLWWPEAPNLYVLKVSASANSSILDILTTQFGVRKIEARGSQLWLNGGVSPFLAGVGRHEDSPDKGRALSIGQISRDLLIIKNGLHANFVRLGHYPNFPETSVLLDRLGLVGYEEIPVYWFDDAAFDLQRTQRFIAKQMWREMIYKDFNRASVWFWGTCNESSGVAPRKDFISDLKQDAAQIDGTRLIMQSAVGKDTMDSTHAAADVVGVTMYYGVFYGTTRTTTGYYNETLKALDDLHRNNPDKPVLVTEYGNWDEADHALNWEQISCFNNTFRAFRERAQLKTDGKVNPDGFLSGAAWWTAFNWYTPRTGLQTMGIMQMDRTQAKLVTALAANVYSDYTNQRFAPQQIPTATPITSFDGREIATYPNPARGIVHFIWAEPDAERVNITVYNMAGERVASLAAVGGHILDWDVAGMAPGIYMYKTTMTSRGVKHNLAVRKLAILL